ncbi:MAG: TetR/AcrR family transcriptional regulator [Bacilli bacterium]
MAGPEKTTKEQILEGARIVFANQGFHATVKEIAKAAGLASPSLVFWHFGDKDQLLMEVATRSSPFSHIAALLDHGPAESVREWLEDVARCYLEGYRDSVERRVFLQIVGHAPSMPALRAMLSKQLTDTIANRLTKIIEREQRSGVIRANADPEFLAQSFLGTLYALITRWEVEGRLPWTEDVIVKQLVGGLLS